MPSRKLFTAIAAPAVLTLASVAPVLGGTQVGPATAAPGSAAPSPAPRPNLVFVMADDLGWADLSSGLPNGGYGNDYNETPRLDQLAEEGQVFTEAYASVQCSPTRTALHTGQYATRPTNNVYAVGHDEDEVGARGRRSGAGGGGGRAGLRAAEDRGDAGQGEDGWRGDGREQLPRGHGEVPSVDRDLIDVSQST